MVSYKPTRPSLFSSLPRTIPMTDNLPFLLVSPSRAQRLKENKRPSVCSII
jgi:hypothetical protein